jgi:hypothetical protein
MLSERPLRLAFGVSVSDMRHAIGLTALAVLGAWPVHFARADTYKCVDNGRTTYQDQPCRSGGSVLRSSNDTPDPRAAETVSKLKASVTQLEQARKQREAGVEIDRLEREIQALDQAEQDELAAIRTKRDFANYNLPGAVWERGEVEQARAKEMQSVTEKYAARKQASRDRVALLRKSAGNGEAPAAPR